MKFRWLLLILAVGLVFRLWHIDFPVGGFQGWRQADTAAMARNFYENGSCILYPQIDWGGAGYITVSPDSGITTNFLHTKEPVVSNLKEDCSSRESPAGIWAI